MNLFRRLKMRKVKISDGLVLYIKVKEDGGNG
jgi:hypothetical protein